MEPDIRQPETFEYIEPRKPIKKSRGGFFVRVLFVLLLLGCLLVAGFVAVLRSNYFQFNRVEVFGVTTFPATEIEQYTREYLSGNYLKVIPKSSTIFFSKDHFEKSLVKRFPIINIAYVSFPKPDSIDIHIQEKTPSIVWCFSDNDCGFVDDQGVIYGRAPEFSDGVYPVFTSEKTDTLANNMGKKIIEPDVMNRFTDLFKKLQSDDITLSRTIFLDNGDIAFSIEKLFGKYPANSARLLGTTAQDDTVFLRDIVTGLSNQAFKNQYVMNPKDLDYIDMRFVGKIFYKFKSKNTPLETASVAR